MEGKGRGRFGCVGQVILGEAWDCLEIGCQM